MDCKNEIYAKNWVRSTWNTKVNSGQKVNPQSKSTVKVNKKSTLTWWVTSADVDDDVSR